MKKVLCFLMIIATLLSTGAVSAFADDSLSKDTDSAITENYYMQNYIGYKYPVLPRTTKWCNFEDHQQMVDACQIPEDVYQNMSTEELAQSILAYPLNADMFAYNSYEMGYSAVKEHFGGLEELSNRDDSASCLIDLYSKQEPIKASELDNATIRAFESDDAVATTDIGQKACKQIFNTLTLALFLSQDDFTEKMTLADKRNLSDIIENRTAVANQMQAESEIIGTTRAGSPSYFISVYGKTSTGSTTIKTPKNGSMTGYSMEALEIWRYTDGLNYIVQLSDLSSDAKTSLNTQYYDIFGINPISGSGPTVKYNCHSYAWYKQTSCNYWVDSPNTTGYTLVDKLTVSVGGKMVYYGSNDESYTTLTHSAVISGIEYMPKSKVSFTVKSKWGMCGLYEHLWYNCPYYYYDANGNSNPWPNDIKLYNS